MVEWFSKILSVIKIPLRILLPTVCLFSAFFVFATDEVLDKLGMLTWSKDNKFAFGISFIISICLLLVYAISFIKNRILKVYRDKTINTKVIKSFGNLSYAEKEILLYLYKSNGYTNTIDYANPIVKGLIYRELIFIGNNVPCQLDWDNRIMIQGTLQPFIWQAFDWISNKANDEIAKLQLKKTKCKDKHKIEKIDTSITQLQDLLSIVRR